MKNLAGAWLALVLMGSLAFGGCGGGGDPADGGTDGGNDGGFMCTGDEDCEGDQKCMEGICRPALYCERNDDCEHGFLCNMINQTCIEAECIEDQDCGPRQYCDEGTCKGLCDEVVCNPGQRCDPNTGECEVLSCTVGSSVCEEDADCPSGLFCDPILKGCTECPTGFTCNQYFCTALEVECLAHSECDVGQRCNPRTNQCEGFPDSCNSDIDCDPKYCNLYTSTCQDEPFTGNCQNDEECQEAYGNPNYYCHPRLETCVLPLQPDECYDTQDCGDPELVCNPKDNTCVERGTVCSTDADCNTGDVCLGGTCVFQCESTCVGDEDCTGYDEVCRNGCCVEDLSCNYDYQCPSGFDCINGWCSQSSPCVDDQYEDNDSAANAYRLSQAPNTTEDYPGLVVCSNDDDWFAIPVPAGHSIRVQIFFSDSAGDVDMRLYNNAGVTSVDSSTSSDDDEEVYYRNTPADTLYYVRIYGWSGASNTYDMRVTIEEIVDPCTSDDAYEENDSWQEATVVAWPALNGTESIGGLGVCAGDDDWFTLTATAGSRLNVSILFAHSYGNLSMEIFDDPESGIPVASGTSSSDNETVAFPVNVETTYYIRVYSASGGNTYSLQVKHDVQICGTDDIFEPNPESSPALMSMPDPGPDEYNDLFLCQDDEDWFAFPLEVGDGLKIDVLFSDAAGDIEVYLYSPSGSTADSSTSASDNEQVEVNAAATAGLYKLKVYHWSGSSSAAQSYDMRVTYYPGGVDPNCEDDMIEPNDSVAEASPLGDTMSNAVLCGANSDYYALDLAAGERVTITCNYDDSQGKDLSMDLLDSDGETVLVAAGGVYTAANRVELSYRAEEVKTVYLHMYMVNPAPAYRDVYDLLVDRAFVDCSDGGYEPNDTWEDATTLTAGNYTGLVLCDTDPDDEDWYLVSLLEGERLHASVDSNPADGDIGLYLYAADGTTQLASSLTGGATEELQSERAFSDTTFYLRIMSRNALGNDLPYRLSIWIDPPIQCTDDSYEQNDSAAEAFAITDGFSASDLVLCHADPDYFSIEVPARYTISVTATYDHMVQDLQLALTSADGSATVASSNTGTGTETIDYVAMAAANLRVRVRIPEPAETDRMDYTLAVSLTEPPPCTDDDLEPNNDIGAASVLDESGHTGLILCPGDVDFFTFPIARGQTASLTLSNTGGVGDADLFVYYHDGEELVELFRSTNSNQADEVISGESYSDEILYVKVVPKNPAALVQIVYDLSLSLGTFVICDDDYLEPNDTRAEATDLNSAAWVPAGSDFLVTYTDLHICYGGDDYFGIDLDEGDTIDVSVGFDSNDIDIYIYYEEETWSEASSAGGSNPEEFSYTAEATGRYYIKVRMYSSTGESDYDMTVTTSRAFICQDPATEPWEPNDNFAEADANEPLPLGITSMLSLCGEDDDYYFVDVAAGNLLSVALGSSGGLGVDLDLFVYDANQNYLGSSANFGSNESLVDISVPTEGAYVLVQNYRPGPSVMAVYELEIGVTAP